MGNDTYDTLLDVLKARFEKNPSRHPDLDWDTVEQRVRANPGKMGALSQMELTGGEPDVMGVDPGSGGLVFCDFSPETPVGRRALCYDRQALDSRKENKPAGSALEMAASMGVDMLTEEQYRGLQELGEFDRKTSSWIKTPDGIRNLGGALFCDRRYDHVFTYHNGADSYYSVRGFRGILRV